MDPEIRTRIYDFLAEKGLRKTAQRDAIIQAAFSTHQHYTAESLLTMSQAVEKSVSRATVYRTLPLLVECGVLREMDFGKNQKYYDPTKRLGFSPASKIVRIEATCDQLKLSGVCKNRPQPG